MNLWHLWDMKASLGHLLRAIELDNSDPEARTVYAGWLASNGRHEEAISQARRAVEKDPFSPGYYCALAWHHQLARQPEEAVETTGRALELEPDHRYALGVQANA